MHPRAASHRTTVTRRAVLGAAAAGALVATRAWGAPARDGAPEPAFDGDAWFDAELEADPTRATDLGIAPYGRPPRGWTIRDDAWAATAQARGRAALATLDRLAAHRVAGVNESLARYLQVDALERLRWRDRDYVFYAATPPWLAGQSLLTRRQAIVEASDAEAYVERVRTWPDWIRHDIGQLAQRHARGVRLPAFNFPPLVAGARAAAGAAAVPESHPLVRDFDRKARTVVPPATLARHRAALSDALRTRVAPALAAAVDRLERLAADRPTTSGVWCLPDGDGYYRSLLATHTTESLDPQTLHAFGRAEVERLTAALAALAPRLGARADTVMQHLANNARYYLPDTAAGRARYVAAARTFIAGMERAVPQLVTVRSDVPLEVREYEPREAATAGRADYLPPPTEGHGPGTLLLNTAAMRGNPTYQLEAIVYHEALPGHHLQATVARAQTNLPRFRRALSLGSATEGWALYAEKIAGEVGGYRSPEGRAGQLALELMRANRVVVDTGVHALRWSYARAVDYLNTHSPNPAADNEREVRRYFNWPAQAVSYTVGLHALERLRVDLQRRAGGGVDARAFHDAVLRAGDLPASLLASTVRAAVGAGPAT